MRILRQDTVESGSSGLIVIHVQTIGTLARRTAIITPSEALAVQFEAL